ncbi:transposase [bacterium]|nr:transposase [bacterium]
MARPPRIEFADAIYHVTTRGVEGRHIVEDNRDRARWLEQLERVTLRHEWRVFAFALMSNHFHLFVQTPLANLSVGMRDLNGGYVSFFNVRHSHQGHLYQGRYKACLVDDEGYWLEVSRYVHLNPVRAGIVEKPEDWPWSSYAGYHRPHQRLEWIDYDRVLEDFEGDTRQGRRQYREFIEDGLGRTLDSPFDRAVHNVVLGSDSFVERVQQFLESPRDDSPPLERKPPGTPPDLSRILSVVADHYGIRPSIWAPGRRSNSPARSVAAYLARELSGATCMCVAEASGYRETSSVTAACKRVAEASPQSRLARDAHLLLTRLGA